MTATLQAIRLATLTCGIFDAAAASMQASFLKIPVQRVWQGVASGLLGPRAFERGRSTAALGLALHFTIAFVISTIYVVIAERLPFLLDRPLLAGALYGIVVFFVMNFIILPLSRRPRRPFNLKFAATQFLIHIVVVGWSIAFSTRHVMRMFHIA